MCAIVGFLNRGGRPAAAPLIHRMTDALAHRGPDGSGVLLRGQVAFGHRRLSIIDPTGGHQPMTNEDGKVWVTFNGEIYNYRALAEELKGRGHVFRSDSDTEVIVHAWEEWGESFLSRLRGMFAFGVMDWRSGKLFLARDQFGIKPLYYIQTPETFAFASELSALRLVPGFDGNLDLTAMDQYLHLQYIPAPRSIYRQIQKLPPAHCLTIDLDCQEARSREYWQLTFRPDETRSEADTIDAVDAAITESIQAHLVSDVPFGAFLSGGVDSSLVVANMSRLLSHPVQTFSIGFMETEFDETHHAIFAANCCNAQSHLEKIHVDALSILPKLVQHYGEPFGDSSAVPTYYVSQLARRFVPMVLSGDGADEMFAGYWSHGDWMEARTASPGKIPQLEDWLAFIRYTDSPTRSGLWRPDFRRHCSPQLPLFAQEWNRADKFSLAHKVQYLDFKTYLPYDILTKVDIASMMHGLEVRTPLVDLRVVELAATIPQRYNLVPDAHGKWKRKHLLKRVAEKYFPPEFLHRPKMGFAMPVARWFAPGGAARPAVEQKLCATNSSLREFFEPAAIAGLLERNAYGPIWLLTVLEEWLNQHKKVVPKREEPDRIELVTGPVLSRPKILVIADVPDWIFARHAKKIAALLADEFEISICYQGEKFNEAEFDLIYPLEFNLVTLGEISDSNKYVTGIRSHLSWQNRDFSKLCNELNQKFREIHVVSERLHQIFKSHLTSLSCLSHGVDTEFFFPSQAIGQTPGTLRLGWAGNRLSASNKGFKDIIEPLSKLPGVELKFCGYQDRNFSLEQMRDFYHGIDAYVCASDFEGNNNSLMEAASMERCIITTDNGAVPEYLIDEENALIVKRSLADFIQGVTRLRDNPALRIRLGLAARRAVAGKFDWNQMAAKHREFFRRNLLEKGQELKLMANFSPKHKSPQFGYSFCIITNGKRPEKLAAEIASIRALQIPTYEILVGGDVPLDLGGVIQIALPEAARAGRLGEMRNRLVEQATYDHLIIADDDMIFNLDFFQGLLKFGEDYQVLCVRLLNIDGSRYWDWATAGGNRGHSLLDYEETDDHVYVTGGLCIAKASVLRQVQWDDKKGFYQGEDLDFSSRLRQAGVTPKFNRHSSVVHTDPRYTQVGRVIMTAENLRRETLDELDASHLERARELYKILSALDADAALRLSTNAPLLLENSVNLPLRWRAPIFNHSGYASEAINFILSLSRRVEIGIFHHNNNYSEKFVAGLKEEDRKRLKLLHDHYPSISGGIVVEHNPANGFTCVPDAAYRIGRTMFETDRISDEWVCSCNQMDEIWVPSQFNVETFARSGVERDKLRIMPEAVDESEFNPDHCEPLPIPNRASCNFLAIFEWSKRKGWDALLEAYLKEFSAGDDVCLYLRTYLFNRAEIDPGPILQQLIRDFIGTLNLGDKPLPRIELLVDPIPQSDLPRLYKAVQCLVAPSRGEGWGRPHHEAMLMGLPVIATNWSGNTEFMQPDNSYLIDYSIIDTANLEPELWHYRGHQWAEPDISSLRGAMRAVQNDPGEARARGQRARSHMLQNYSRSAVADLVIARLKEIEQLLTKPVCRPANFSTSNIGSQPFSDGCTVTVSWEGSFKDFGSLSHVNRELTQVLFNEPGLKVSTGQPSSAKKSASASDVTVRHAWPPNWESPQAGAWVMIQPWEFGVLPKDWIKKIAKVDEVWVPSNYARRVYIDSGITPSKVKIVPNGIDPDRFRLGVEPMALPTNKKFKFLFVGGTIARKGPDILLRSFLETFTAADDVCLVIKDFGNQSVYQGQTLEKEIIKARLNPLAPEIVYLTEEISEAAMPGLYAACNCLVHPYRGEGFGLPVLEAMACGLAVVVTSGGSTDDFATDEYAFRLPSLRVPIGNVVGGMRLVRNGWWLDPSYVDLCERLRWIAAHPVEAASLGNRASIYVRSNWTWRQAAQIASDRLHKITQQKHAEKMAAVRPGHEKKPFCLPDVAKLGDLATAQTFFNQGRFTEAWKGAIQALQQRPFNPPALLFLSEIALTNKNPTLARECLRRAESLAPHWVEVERFSKRLREQMSNRKTSIKASSDKIDSFALPEPQSLKLTVCLIVKNEERFIGRCLASIKMLAAQIVVVDTGSTDRTVEIARQFGAEIYYVKWADDFSGPRNLALSHATGDWILSLDADEELLPEHQETLRRELQDKSSLAFRLPILDKGREKEGSSYVPRLFRNAPGLFFLGRIHEQAFSSILVRCQQWKLKNKLGQTTLLHHGYSAEMTASRGKISRNIRLLELAISEMPDEANLVMNFGMELIRAGRFSDGIKQYCEAVRLMSLLPVEKVAPELRETLLTQITTHLLGAGCYTELIELWSQPFPKSSPMTASQHFMLGLALMETNQPDASAGHMRQCLKKRELPTLCPVNKDILLGAPRHCLALSLCALKDVKGAEQAFRQALVEDSCSRPLRFDWAKFQFQNGETIPALAILNQLISENPIDLAVLQFGGHIAANKPELLEFAQTWTTVAIENFPADPVIIAQRAEVLTLSQDFEAAFPLWCLIVQSPRQAAARLLCEFLLDKTCKPTAMPEVKVSQEFLKWYRQLINFKANSTIHQINEHLEHFRSFVPTAIASLERALQKAEPALSV